MLTLGSQIELAGGWRDAWRHELRGPHGEWVRGPQMLVDRAEQRRKLVGDLRDRQGDAARFEGDDLYRGIDAMEKGDDTKAVRHLLKAMRPAERLLETAQRAGDSDSAEKISARVDAYKRAIRFLDSRALPDDKPVSADVQRVHQFMVKNARSVARMFGPDSQLYWDGAPPDEFDDMAKPGTLADIGWNGHMGISKSGAAALTKLLDSDGPVDDPDPVIVPLHEMIHVVEPKGEHTPHEYRLDDANAYNDRNLPGIKAIEEGFTQLGTAHHAEEFFNAVGLGDRETNFAADDSAEVFERKRGEVAVALNHLADDLEADGRPPETQVARKLRDASGSLFDDETADADRALTIVQHLGDKNFYDKAIAARKLLEGMYAYPKKTMAEWARDMAKGDRIRNGESWQHYNAWTKDAYNFAAYLSVLDNGKEDPETIKWISDQVNRVGPSNKPIEMAALIFASMGYPPGTVDERTTRESILAAEATVESKWSLTSPQAVVDAARNQIRRRVKDAGQGVKQAS